MAVDNSKDKPKYIVTLAKGDMVSLKSIGLTEEEIKKYSVVTSSETEHADASGGMIRAKAKGEATITLKAGSNTANELLKVKVKVVESGTYLSPAIDLSGFLMIGDELKEKLVNNEITSMEDIIKAFGSNDSRRDYSKKLDISEYEAGVYFRQAALWQVPMMTKEFSYLAALVGIRNAEDLSRVNALKLQQAFELLRNNIMISFRDFDFPDYTLITELIQSAKDMNSKYYDYYNIDGGLDPVPSSLIDNDGILKSDSEIINEGLKFLENIKPALPLPQTISGYVKVKDTKDTSNEEADGTGGLLVSISGISNPAQDKTEDEQEYYCYTDPSGYFTIDMPDKYNMQETVKISVSKKSDMTYAIAGQNSSHKVEFVKRASEIMQNEYTTIDSKRIKAYDILNIINTVRNDNARAMEIERKLKELAYYRYAEGEKQTELANLQDTLKNNKIAIEHEVLYHIYNRRSMIENLKKQNEDGLDKIIEVITKTFNEDRAIYCCAALLMGIPFPDQSKEKTDNKTSGTKTSAAAAKTATKQAAAKLSTEKKFQKLVRHSKNFDLEAAPLDSSKKIVVGKMIDCFIQIDEMSKKKIVNDEAANIIADNVAVNNVTNTKELIKADNTEINETKESLISELEALLKELIEFQEAYISKFSDLKNGDKFNAVNNYENEYLPEYSALIQSFMSKLFTYSAEKNNTEVAKYDYKNDGICDTLEELGAKCDLSPYYTIKDAINSINKIENDWKRAIAPEINNNDKTKENEEQYHCHKEDNAPYADIMAELDKDHFCHEGDTDPYVDIINKLPFGNERCNLLRDKIDTYIKTKEAIIEVIEELAFIAKKNDLFEESNKENTYLQTYIYELENGLPEEYRKSSEGENADEDDLSDLPYESQLYVKYKRLIAACTKNLSKIYDLENIQEYRRSDNDEEQDNEGSEQSYTSSQIERCIINFLSASFDSEFDEDDFIISQSDFEDNDLHPRVLPSVKLMGDGNKEVFLPTDTAPSRMFNYTMVHRLVEPKIRKNGKTAERSKLDGAIKVQEFKSDLYTNPDKITVANSLGIGYSLNMHQAWVPDGFALGNLLYSLVLAPGEEQRLIVREHKEDYSVSDDASAMDTLHDSYSNSQVDNETAAFSNAVDRFSSAHSDSSYYSKATSKGGAGIGFFFGIGATTSSTSTNSGSSSSNSSQRDSYDEASHAAQSFQTSIKTESERIASARRTSISVATSEETESVSSRIIANHNHSHVMTVQYWEVARRYRLETCIDGVELLLFVPLELIRFMPRKGFWSKAAYGDYSDYSLKLDKETVSNFTKSAFEYRYGNILKYYDIIERYVPFRYRSGLNLIKKFSAIPYWKTEGLSDENKKYTLTVTGGFCEFDNLSATVYFNNGSNPVQGILQKFETNKLELSEKTENGRQKKPHTRKEVIEAILSARNKSKTAKFTFTLPYGCNEGDISQISIRNDIKTWKYTLSQDTADMEEWEKAAVEKYEAFRTYYAEDNRWSSFDKAQMDHYAKSLPECYNYPIATFSASELYNLGDLDITVKEGENNKQLSTGVLNSYYSIYKNNEYPMLRLQDIQKIEETFHHIVSDTMHYSQVIWSSLTDNERILLLEPYTIEFDNIDKIASPDCSSANIYKSKKISLINCVNAKKVVGFYGNCMMLPFTFPKELAELLGKTSGDIQDELYRYHACNFRVPSTVISVPTDGMIGEAVLGATNVSEKIDITRFWNWKDSDIDHINIDQSSLNGRSLLESAHTKDVDAPTVGVTATEHINGNNLASALIARQQPTFADVYTNTDMRDVMKNADNNASAGREQVVKTTSELAKAALDAAVKAGTTAATGGAAGALGGVASGALGGSSGGAISGILGALGDAGLGDANLGKLMKEGLGDSGSLSGIAKSIVGMVGDGESDALKKALASIGGDDLKQFLSKFESNASEGGSSSLESNFMDSISGLINNPSNIKSSDIIDMAKKFCSENNIKLSDVTSFLGKKLGLF